MHCLMKAWNENEQAIKNWLLKQTRNHDQTQDLLQDVFIKALQKKEQFCSLDDAKSWLFKVAKNSLIDSYRRANLELGTVNKGPEEDQQDVVIQDLQHCLNRVISELDDDDKDVIEQCDIHGMPQSKYASLKKLSLTATKSRIQRARKKLRQQMIISCNVEFDQQQVCCFTPRN